MKRTLAWMIALLTLTMALGLAGCGSSEENTDTTDAAVALDLAAVRDQIVADCGIEDALMVETEGLESLYGITADEVTESAGFTATSTTAFPQEVVMVQAVDEAAAAEIQTKLENHLSAIAETAASYDPDSLSLAENCPVVVNGTYVGMFFSPDYDVMVNDFQGN